MKKRIMFASLLALSMACLVAPAAGLAAEPSALPSQVAAVVATPPPLPALPTTWGGWMTQLPVVVQLFGLVVALSAAWCQQQWRQVLNLAGAITAEVAKMTPLNNAEKRREAARLLRQRAPTLAQAIFSEEDFLQAVEYGWQVIAKPAQPAAPPIWAK